MQTAEEGFGWSRERDVGAEMERGFVWDGSEVEVEEEEERGWRLW
jgi:hypothetical protein